MNPGLKIRSWLDRLAPRERRFVLLGAAGAAVLIVLGGAWRLHAAVAAGERRIEKKTADLAWMQAVAPAVQAAAAGARAGSEPLALLVDRTAREAGLASALAGSEPAGPTALRVRFSAASFDVLVAWLAALQAQHRVAVGSANVERGAAEGTVNATFILQRS